MILLTMMMMMILDGNHSIPCTRVECICDRTERIDIIDGAPTGVDGAFVEVVPV